MFNYQWNLKDGYKKKNNKKVFSTFACGGGSTMGYKLAGFEVIGANDIDPQMAKVYKQNHHPKIYIEKPIGDLLTGELPKELFDLDILDGSPPCSTFSMSGAREKNWKKNKKFREGQSEQVLSDLFFDFIALTKRLQSKIVVAENVKGMLAGNAKAYTAKILKDFDSAGYDTQLFCLNAGSIGVPQRRERVFFIGRRKDLKLSKLQLEFHEKPITFAQIDEGILETFEKIENSRYDLWDKTKEGDSISRAHPKGSFFNSIKISRNKVCNTIASGSYLYHPVQKRKLTTTELIKVGTFPLDYDFMNVKPIYLIGMSVPPVMVA